ncbi:Adenylosuccinate synthetase [Nannocystis exedens]|uniref:Adenylosuccinate synthetase n=1 Tax=Nannocystis exedens TaxID=54 RepID=A0A1I1T9Q1_9BACT|nr:adenylosuccinate synthase [Nannocystis exedens]PCC66694.1 adenylosuccinate synthase [Nannocystis exedens]SFD55329.1 Adenylosuccinate synthetase [Nannocystis exedens]
MTTLIVVGAQWGDEGKGKVVDYLASQAQLVARYAGGNNAGHTLVIGGRKLVTHLVPSGCAYPGTPCVLGAGMVIDVDVFRAEVEELQSAGMLQGGELRVSRDAHVIFPHHRLLDGLREDRAQAAKIGTTRRGIGPAYEAKAGRRGVRVRDLFRPERLRARLELAKEVVDAEIARLGSSERVDVAAELARAEAWAAWLGDKVCDAGELVDAAIRAGKRVLFEGAQGALLDLDHGTYPFVTSSTTLAGGVCSGIGVGPTAIDGAWGISKAYATRVGAGPFPTKLEGPLGDELRRAGDEFGATTGRPRDCGWLDLPALRYAARLNGLTGLCITKVDVLAAMPEVQVCRAYADGASPGDVELDEVVPVLSPVAGWGDPSLRGRISAARRLEDLPAAVRAYLDLIADEVGVPITLVSLGPDREQTILLRDPF